MTDTATPQHWAAPTDVASTLGRLRSLADRQQSDADWQEASALTAALEARVNLGDRRSIRAQRQRDELIRAVRAALPGHEAGLVLVAEFRTRRFHGRWPQVTRHWPVIGERVRVTTAWTPDNSKTSVWTRGRATGQHSPFTPAQLRRLDRLVRTLERRGVFDTALFHQGRIVGFGWMDPEPWAYPGLERLVVTINPPVLTTLPRPAPTDPLMQLHHLADLFDACEWNADLWQPVQDFFTGIGWTLLPYDEFEDDDEDEVEVKVEFEFEFEDTEPPL